MALSDLKAAVAEGTATAAPAQSKPDVPKLDAKGRAYGTGRRKDAAARVWVSRGNGKVTVNGRDIATYFARGTQQLIVQQAFDVAGRVNQFDVECTVKGGGLSGQAGAILHGLARALVNFEPALRAPLKKAGFLTRDSRVVERKKYGKHGARRSTQWVKR